MQFDLTRPNTGRMIDYWLGGTHHFEIDRQLAEQVGVRFPIIKGQIMTARSLVNAAVNEFYGLGIRAFLDFGASLPTCENTHIVAKRLDPNIKVVYSDIDPITIAYAQDLLKDEPKVIYLEGDATHPQMVLDAPATVKLLGDERRVGIIFLNLAHLMSDQQVRSSWQALYDWAAPGSYMSVSMPSENWMTEPDLLAVGESYGRSGLSGYYRNPAQLEELARPWKLTPAGVLPNTKWNMPNMPKQERLLGYAFNLYK